MRLALDLMPNPLATILAARQRFDEQNTLRNVFPVETTTDVRFRLLQRKRVDPVGAVRALSTPAREIQRAGVIEVRGGIPAVSAITRFTESDLQQSRILSGLDTDIATLEADVNEAAGRVAIAVDNTYELLRGAVLTTGRLSINNGEAIQEADFGVPAGNFVTPAKPWSDPTALVLDDWEAWANAYLETAGVLPTTCYTTRRTIAYLRRNEQIRQLLGTTAGGTPLVTLDAINNHLASEGLPTIAVGNLQERRIGGRRVFAEGKFVWTTGAQIGRTIQGVAERAVQLTRAQVLPAAQAPGVVVATLVEDEPVARHVVADSSGLPVIDRPDELFVATVAAP